MKFFFQHINSVPSTMQQLAVFAAFFCSPVALGAEEQFEMPPIPQHLELPDCELGSECPIPFDHLSNQETEPFLTNGKVMDESLRQWRTYGDAISEFPDVRSCLLASEQQKEMPNLLLIDWAKTKVHPGGTVCMFRIGSSLGHPELFRKWFEYHDFRLRGYHLERYGSDGGAVSFEGSWTPEEYRKRKPNWFVALTGLEIVNGVGRKVTYSRDLKVLDLSQTGSTKFN